MSPTAAQQQAMLALLGQEQLAVEELITVLQQEHDALGRRVAEDVTQAVAAKEKALFALHQLAQQRAQLMQQAGLNTDKEGFNSFITSDTSGQLEQRWAELEERLRECQRQNQINGSLLESGRQATQEVLSILTGRDFSQNELYNQKGRTSSSLGQNTSFKV